MSGRWWRGAWLWSVSLAIAIGGTGIGLAFAQSQPAEPVAPAERPGQAERGGGRPGAQGRRAEMAREAFRARLERRRAMLTEMLARTDTLLAELDRGTELSAIRAQADELERQAGNPDGDGVAQADAAPPVPDAERERPERAPLSEDERAGALRLMQEHRPEAFEEYEQLRARDPRAAERMLERAAPRLREVMALRDRDPQAFDQRLRELGAFGRAAQMARRIAAGESTMTPDALAAAKQRLREAVNDVYTARLETQQRELDALTARLAGVRSELEERTRTREQAVDEHTERMLSRARAARAIAGPDRAPGEKPRNPAR